MDDLKDNTKCRHCIKKIILLIILYVYKVVGQKMAK